MSQPSILSTLVLPVLPSPLEVIIRGKDNPVAFACPTCGLLFILEKDASAELKLEKRDQAAAHCVKQCVCGKTLDYHYYLRCADCRALLEAEKEKARFSKALKLSIEEYPDDPVYWDGHGGDMGDGADGYFSNVDSLLDYCEGEGLDLPLYVWACTRHDFKLDAEQVLQDALEQQDMSVDNTVISVPAGKQLQAFFDAWVKEQGLHAWFYDAGRAVVLRENGSSPPPAVA